MVVASIWTISKCYGIILWFTMQGNKTSLGFTPPSLQYFIFDQQMAVHALSVACQDYRGT